MLTQVATIIADTLQYVGVKRIYGIGGVGINILLNALSETSIQFIQTRNEEAAAFAAGGDAHITKELAVCCGSANAGSVHLLNGLYDAHRNGCPVLCIATSKNQMVLGQQNITYAMHQSFSDCSCFCEEVQAPAQIERLLGMAMQSALSLKGVAVLIIPENIFSLTTDFDTIKFYPHLNKGITIPSEYELKEIADKINDSLRIVIFGGSGCIGAHDEIMAFAKKIKAAVGWAYRGKEALDFDNPYPIGMNGLLGDQSCLHALDECDLLLLLGTDFAFSQFYPEDTAIIQIDIKGENLGKRHAIDLGVVGDIKATVSCLIEIVKEKENDIFASENSKLYQNVQKHYEHIAKQNNDELNSIYPEYLSHMLNQMICKDAIIVSDVGTPWAYMAKYIDTLGSRRLYHSSLHGTMANALSSSIGLQAAAPDKQVVAMCGDGGFSMLMGELLTIKQEKLPVKIIIFNNHRLDFVALEMKTEGLIDSFTDLKNPSFAEYAESIHIKGIHVAHPNALESALKEAFDYDGPAVIDVNINPNSLLMPPDITLDMMYKFSKYMWKAFIHGDSKTIWDTLKINFPRQL
ncbi:MAG: thiamine pyrophosphate-dependent enzyme [Bacteroidales bacterium]